MSGIVRISGSQFNGRTVLEALQELASNPQYAYLKDQSVIVIRNGNLVISTDYGCVTISENDEITVMKLLAGG